MRKADKLHRFIENLFNIQELELGPDSIKDFWPIALFLLIPMLLILILVFKFGFENFNRIVKLVWEF